MTPQATPASGAPLPADVQAALEQIPGNEAAEELATVYTAGFACPGLVLLYRPSVRVAVAAALGTFGASTGCDPARVYVVHPDGGQLRRLFRELSLRNLADEVTLYHGSMGSFFRDLPLRPDLIGLMSDDVASGAIDLRNDVVPGTPVLLVGASPDSAAARDWLANGCIERAEGGLAPFRTTTQCHGTGTVPDVGLRRALQGRLHQRYFASSTESAGSYTPVADLCVDIRHILATANPGVSGYGIWPYTSVDPLDLPPSLPGGRAWPRISIVTPSYNQGRYIEQTILSVLHQGYPNLEHIIMDGGSRDETPAVLERYRDRVAVIVSEPDRGQSHAINKGMARATGEIVTWLNSDDMLAPGALGAMAMAFATSGADMVAGICRLYKNGEMVNQHLTSCADGPLPLTDLLDLEHGWNAGQFFHQPEVMFTRELWLRAGGHVREDLHYSMDYELWLRFAKAGARMHVVGRPMAWFRVHEEQKTYSPADFTPELTVCRDGFLRDHGIAAAAPASTPPLRGHLRITLLNDHGSYYGAGIANTRLARALAWAGHEVNMVSILESPGCSALPPAYTVQGVVDQVSATQPDVVLIGNLHNAEADPVLLQVLSEKFLTLVVLHDFWLLTGRCTYTGSCTKYLSGCDHTCPTANEYPALPPAEIADSWRTKRLLLGMERAPILLANSEWTAAFARDAFAQSPLPAVAAPAIEVCRLSFPLDILRPRDKRACREALGLPQDRFLVLLPASLDDPRKGGRQLLEALERLQLPDLQVVTIGAAPVSLETSLDIVQIGYVADQQKVAMLHSAVDVVASPSTAETFGQVCMEAIACGTPVVGYPVAAVREAIVDGVTGMIAADTEPSSLAAAIQYLYMRPELRRNLGRWGRMLVENEWSEFSAYRHFFLALQRLGLTEYFHLRRKISFQPRPPAPPLRSSVWDGFTGWRAGPGFSGVESAPDLGLDQFRWACGPGAYAEIPAPERGMYWVFICFRNPHESQQMTLTCNGTHVGYFDLVRSGHESGRVLIVNLTLEEGANLLHLKFTRWHAQPDSRLLALMITDIRIERVPDWAQRVQLPDATQMLRTVWGANGPDVRTCILPDAAPSAERPTDT